MLQFDVFCKAGILGGEMLHSVINKPNFFILGAGKSGSTSLYDYLKQHPAIFMTEIKEPTFFNEGFQIVQNPIKYFELFDSVGAESVIGEASHVYLTNPSTPRVIKGLFPDAKFVLILRNPADRAYSLYHHMRRQGWEWINTFEKALAAEEKRVVSSRFKRKCPHYYYNYLYFRSGLYGEQIQRYFSLFDKDRFHFLSLDLLKADPEVTLRNIFKFLEVDPDFKPVMEIQNEGRITARLPFVHYLWNTKFSWPRPIRRVGLQILRKINIMPIPTMNPETRNELIKRYERDFQLLHDLTGIRFDSSRKMSQRAQPSREPIRPNRKIIEIGKAAT